MRVAVVGIGHVGLPTAATLAEFEHDVIGIDEDEEKIRGLQRGATPFFEPGLAELVERGARTGRLRFSVDAAEAIQSAEVVFLCVGTPARASGDANLVAVERSARGIAPHLSPGVIVVKKSTVPAGTAQRLRQVLRMSRPLAEDIEGVSNPEF